MSFSPLLCQRDFLCSELLSNRIDISRHNNSSSEVPNWLWRRRNGESMATYFGRTFLSNSFFFMLAFAWLCNTQLLSLKRTLSYGTFVFASMTDWMGATADRKKRANKIIDILCSVFGSGKRFFSSVWFCCFLAFYIYIACVHYTIIGCRNCTLYWFVWKGGSF